MNLRNTSDLVRFVGFAVIAAGLLLLVGCGGSSNGGGSNGGGNTTIVVSVSPTSATVALGAQSQFTVSVSGTSSTAVTWQVNGTSGGNSTVGTVNSSGLYTAPITAPSSNSVTITAVLQSDTAISGSATVNFPAINTQPISVDLGPTGNYANGLFTTVRICVPGTTSCQDIDNVLVDTGSYGLRVLENGTTPLGITLPQVTDNTSNPLYNCTGFADGSFVWGPVATADIQMVGEKASAVPIQVISANPSFKTPSTCGSGAGMNDNTVATLGANGILGVGVFLQDCGSSCISVPSPAPSSWPYYLCSSSGCVMAAVPLSTQLLNPVALFPQDNNGLLISLPSVPDTGAPSVSGSMIFGIGTQSDNTLSSAKVYTADGCGNISTTYNGKTYSDSSTSCAGGSYFDTGSNGLYVLDAATLGQGIVDCPSSLGGKYYCPAQKVTFTVTNTGTNSTSGQVSFSIANAEVLLTSNNGQNAAFNDLGGVNPGAFDFGLPFFFGRNVFVGIENQTSPGGTGPYWAY